MATVVNCAAYENGRRVTDLDINDPEQMKPKAGRVIWIGLTGQQLLCLGLLAALAVWFAFRRPPLATA